MRRTGSVPARWLLLAALLLAGAAVAFLALRPRPTPVEPAEATAPVDTGGGLTAEQVAEYRRGLTDPHVVHLRRALDAYRSGSREGVDEFAVDDGQGQGLRYLDPGYLASPFVLVSAGRHFGGGRSLEILFPQRPDRIFSVWIYETGDGALWLRGFRAVEVPREDLDAWLQRMGPFLAQPENAL